MKRLRVLCAVSLLAGASPGWGASVTWNSTTSNDWNTAANWIGGSGVPRATDGVVVNGATLPPVISGFPTLGINTGTAVTVTSFTSSQATLYVLPQGPETLQIAGNITAPPLPGAGDPALTLNFNLPVIASGTAPAWTGLVNFNSTITVASNVTISSGTATIAPGAILVFDLASTTQYGQFTIGTAGGVAAGQSANDSFLTITFAPGFAPSAPFTFNLVALAGSGDSISNVFENVTWDTSLFAELPAGLVWDDSDLINGNLSIVAVPEPAVLSLVAGGLLSLALLRRRRGIFLSITSSESRR